MYEIQVNGETVWTGDDERLVTEISVQTPRGESTRLRIPPEERIVNLVIQERSLELYPLDIVESEARQAHRDRFEGADTEISL